jgi:hypothetical protein
VVWFSAIRRNVMKAICTVIGVVAAVLVLATAASADMTVYSENFESMTPGDLRGQGGWTAEGISFFDHPVDVGTAGGALTNMQILPDGAAPGYAAAARHSLGSLANLSSSDVTTLSWDAQYGSANSNFGFYVSNDVLGMGFESAPSGWKLDARGLTGGSADYASVTGGKTGAVKFKVVVDGPAGTAAGYYDFGGGYTLAGSYSATSTQIQSVVGLYVSNDYRGGGVGNGTDNISLNTNATPEPSSMVLVVCAMMGLLAYAWRKRK